MEFHTILDLGPKRSVTKEGFTLFRDVSISRTGEQIYGPGETSIEPGPDGLVYITRTPEEVFRPETLASINGKSLVIDHPEDDVGPDNWSQLSHGILFNARRGIGEQSSECVADVLVTTRQGIQAIDDGKREVSLGYDADYFQTAPGRGEQRSIYVNHNALVDAGRCGSRCAVKDSTKPHCQCKGAITMADKKLSIKDRIMAAFHSRDEAAIKKVADEAEEEDDGPDGGTHTHIHIGESSTEKKEEKTEPETEEEREKRLAKMEDSIGKIHDALAKLVKDKAKDDEEETEEERKKRLEKEKEEKTEDDDPDDVPDDVADEAPEGKQEEAKKAKDSAYLADSFEQVKSTAEIISPGVRIPTFDHAADPKKTFKDCICGLRRKSLGLGTKDSDTASLINRVAGRTIDAAVILKMPCAQLRPLFNGVGTLKAQQNDAAVFTAGNQVRDAKVVKSPEQTFADAAAAKWNNKK
jgi:hypothetical protein